MAWPGRRWCIWHDPGAEEQRREMSRRGGEARSNQARARKELGATLTSDDLLATLSRAIKRVEKGELEAGPANAIASLARAMNVIREATEVERRLEVLEHAARERGIA